MTKHTPGPWVKKNGYLMGSNGRDVVAAGLGLGLGADCGDGVRNANARLIAAAPDLLEALQSLLDSDLYADGEGILFIKHADTPDGERAVKMARAAIAKATGEQS